AQDVVNGLVATDPVKRGTRFQVFPCLHDRRPGQGLGTRVAARRRYGGETLLLRRSAEADRSIEGRHIRDGELKEGAASKRPAPRPGRRDMAVHAERAQELLHPDHEGGGRRYGRYLMMGDPPFPVEEAPN